MVIYEGYLVQGSRFKNIESLRRFKKVKKYLKAKVSPIFSLESSPTVTIKSERRMIDEVDDVEEVGNVGTVDNVDNVVDIDDIDDIDNVDDIDNCNNIL